MRLSEIYPKAAMSKVRNRVVRDVSVRLYQSKGATSVSPKSPLSSPKSLQRTWRRRMRLFSIGWDAPLEELYVLEKGKASLHPV